MCRVTLGRWRNFPISLEVVNNCYIFAISPKPALTSIHLSSPGWLSVAFRYIAYLNMPCEYQIYQDLFPHYVH